MDERIAEAAARTAADHGITDVTPGFAALVERAGEVVYRGAFGCADLACGRPLDPADNFIIASNTKQLCCLCIVKLAEEGKIGLDEPIGRFFPDFPEYARRVTPAQMMSHTSGLPDYYEEGFANGFSPEVERLRYATTADMLEYFKTFDAPSFEPDAGWEYSNTGFVMLGDIVRQLSGVGFGAYLEREVLRPLGMDRSFAPDDYDSRDPWLVEGYGRDPKKGFVKRPYDMLMVGFADGNVSSNVDDLLTWHRWLYEGVGPDIVSEESKSLLFRDHVLRDGRLCGYGFGLNLGKTGAACDSGPHIPGVAEIWHSGDATGFRSMTSRFTDDDTSVIILFNDEGLEREEILVSIARAALGLDDGR
jgi:CubicO group peptidase (beta-lactamase class C family)